MREIGFSHVIEVWRAAGGKDTNEILGWFRPPTTTTWREGAVRADEVGDLRFIGGDPGSQWEVLTQGRYAVRDAPAVAVSSSAFRWDPAWRIIAIRDPESGRRTIIDGNTRALELHRAVQRGEIPPQREVVVISGDLDVRLVRIAKSAASLWR